MATKSDYIKCDLSEKDAPKMADDFCVNQMIIK